jgi:hypothetical protein
LLQEEAAAAQDQSEKLLLQDPLGQVVKDMRVMVEQALLILVQHLLVEAKEIHLVMECT